MTNPSVIKTLETVEKVLVAFLEDSRRMMHDIYNIVIEDIRAHFGGQTQQEVDFFFRTQFLASKNVTVVLLTCLVYSMCSSSPEDEYQG